MDALQTLKTERAAARAAARTLAQRVKPGPWIALSLPTYPPSLQDFFCLRKETKRVAKLRKAAKSLSIEDLQQMLAWKQAILSWNMQFCWLVTESSEKHALLIPVTESSEKHAALDLTCYRKLRETCSSWHVTEAQKNMQLLTCYRKLRETCSSLSVSLFLSLSSSLSCKAEISEAAAAAAPAQWATIASHLNLVGDLFDLVLQSFELFSDTFSNEKI